MSIVDPVLINKERCKGCQLCVRFCPLHLLILGNSINSSGYVVVELIDSHKCTRCTACALICPDNAVVVLKRAMRPASGCEELQSDSENC